MSQQAMSQHAMSVCWAVLVLAGAALGQGGQSGPAPAAPEPMVVEPEVAPTVQRVVVKARELDTADGLLTALETADRNLRTFTAGIQYTKKFADIEGGDRQMWRGKLSFDSEAARGDIPARKRFAVIFDTLLVGQGKDAVKRTETKHLVFDGEWFVERNASAKQFTKRRVVAPGQRADPLKLGEGPFPLPIGQKKQDILSRFVATVVPYGDGLDDAEPAVRERYKDTVQLKLTPRIMGRDARDFVEIRIWYIINSPGGKTDLLPRLARTRTAEGKDSEILLINQAVNGPIDGSAFDIRPPAEPGWSVDVREQARSPVDEDGVRPGSGGEEPKQ